MKNIILNLTRKQLFLGSVILCLLSDLMSSIYLTKYFSLPSVQNRFLNYITLYGQSTGTQFPDEFLKELLQVIERALGFMLFALILTNLVFYLFFYRGKAWAYRYVLGYCGAGVAISILSLTEGFPVGGVWEILNFASLIIYAVVGISLKIRKKEFNPKSGTQAQ